jgi:hypothetical protein
MSDTAEKYAAITELIGEMSWGIDVPSPIVLSYVERLGEGIKTIAMTPKSMEPVFEAIYQKLKTAPNYNPLKDANQRIFLLEKVISDMATDPMGEYYTGLRCGVEDRDIYDRYAAVEYGWQEAFEYIGSIAAGYLEGDGE